MDIYIKNIGIVKESTIQLDGLTVIAGKNNSGKTTVGKVLYSLLDAVSSIKEKVLSDRKSYISKQLYNVESALEVLELCMRSIARYNKEAEFMDSALYQLFSDHRRNTEGIERLAHQVYEELKAFSLSETSISEEAERYFKLFIRDGDGDKESILDYLKKQIDNAIIILDNAFANLEKDPELIQYAKESIQQTLLAEFSEQIQPVRNPDAISSIRVFNDGNTCFSMEIKDNRITTEDRTYFVSPCQKVYLIDDPFVLDNTIIARSVKPRASEYSDIVSILNTDRVFAHNEKLKRVLRFKAKPSILEKTIIDESLKPIRERINSVLPGQFEFSQEGNYYVHSGMKLHVSNLATGSKMFSLIKLLLDIGELDNTTMLILDEPEAHLHPMWQNVFAEVIVLLAKELGVRILLTTHSPNFMLAIDAYMRKYSFAEKTNFYQTDTDEEGFVTYRCVNNNMDLIYGDFLKYLSDVKNLRDSYLYGTGE